MENIFNLSDEQLLEIAGDLKNKIISGLSEEGKEIKCLPTYIHPKKDGVQGRSVVFDLGGTNFRAAVVSVGESTEIEGIVEKDITEMKNTGFTGHDLYKSQQETIGKLDLPKCAPVGYCFSYPAKSLTNGDAELLTWCKGVSIPNMVGKPVGEPLLDFLNKNTSCNFNKISVVNDTITSLFAGLLNPGYDAYIGLIVGTGTNMATFFPSEYIPKLGEAGTWKGETPVNLETGNFNPPHLTSIDVKVDMESDNAGFQRFEKAISGMYLGRVFRTLFPNGDFDENLDAAGLSRIMNNPGLHKQEYVDAAFQIYERSAKLVAASIAGLLMNLNEAYPTMNKIQVLAEGSLFWSKVKVNDCAYAGIVSETLNRLIEKLGLDNLKADISKIDNANLIGAAMAVLS
jgi:hexokinase